MLIEKMLEDWEAESLPHGWAASALRRMGQQLWTVSVAQQLWAACVLRRIRPIPTSVAAHAFPGFPTHRKAL